MKEIIKVKDLSRYYGSKENKNVALNDINFSIEEGEFVSIMGPSGCGKSTLLYSIAGLDKPNKGSVIIDDTDIYNLNDKNLSEFRRSMIGFIFQFYNLVLT